MRRALAPLCVITAMLGPASTAMADRWPLAGGTASRSGNAAAEPGETPITGAWATPDGRVRTPIVITGGGGPDVQRVAYGTADGFLHMRILASGAPVGPATGVDLDGGTINDNERVFGSGLGSVGFADTSTDDHLGQLLVVHNDDAGGISSVFVGRVRLSDGTVVADEVVPSSGQCSVDSSPLLTPPSPGGTRILYFTMLCAQGLSRYLVRVPVQSDPGSPVGTYGYALVPDTTETASPSLVVLRDKQGTPRFHVAVARKGAISIFDAEDPLEPLPGNTETPPAFRAALADPAEEAQTPTAATAPSGLVAGSDGSATGPAPALFVAANASGATRVYRFVQTVGEDSLRMDKVTGPLADSGAPAPAMAIAETVTPSGLSAGGTLVVTTASNAILLRTNDLSEVARLSASPLPAGSGFARSAAAVSGAYAYLVRDGATDKVPEHLALRLDGLAPLAAPAFAHVADSTPGQVTGQPAIARGEVIYGAARGALAYLTRDVTGPTVAVAVPAAGETISGTVAVSAVAADPRGVGSVTIQLSTDGGSTRVIGKATAPDAGSAFEPATYSIAFPTASVANGDYVLDAVAVDVAGNSTTSERVRIKIANPGGTVGLPPGACANLLLGTLGADRIVGTASGDRILGGAGDDRIDGGGGHDCLLGEAGNDALSGGAGDDLLEGGDGNDSLLGGSGRNRLDGGTGDDSLHGGKGVEVLLGGAGADKVLGGDGNDRLVGGGGNDRLDGGSGSDRIYGGDGKDVIVAGGGSNHLDGGRGADRISAVNGRRDVIVCGAGIDHVTADLRDRVARNCERVKRRRR